MSRSVLVAGATGVLGREICTVLKERGDRVIALARSAAALQRRAVPHDEARIVDLLRPRETGHFLDGVQAVISAVGASVSPTLRGRTTYSQYDYPANGVLIEEAKHSHVRRFVYASVFGAREYPGLNYFAAHAHVEEHLAESGLPHAVIRPTGFFAILEDMLGGMARRGAAPAIGDGNARTNPIHERDVAEACVDALSDLETPRAHPLIRDIGGPEVFTRRELIELAFAAVGKQPRFIRASRRLMNVGARLARPLHPRLADLVEFIVHVSTHDVVAPPAGRRTLADYLRAGG